MLFVIGSVSSKAFAANKRCINLVDFSMKVVLSSRSGRTRRFNVERLHVAGFFSAIIAVLVSAIVLSYQVGHDEGSDQIDAKVFAIQVEPAPLLAEFERVLAEQEASIDTLSVQSENELRALSQRVGQLQAHVMRIDALGQRVASMADLKDGEFDFSATPAQGGPADDEPSDDQSVPDFLASLNAFEAQLNDRTEQLAMLESMVVKSQLNQQTEPSGRPVNTGWLSSKFGARRDPFDGHVRYHYGVDFASPHGSDVIAVGSGLIQKVEDRRGYGLLVEVKHGEGFVTRYAHNSAVTVQEGDMVERGQVIAKVGKSGRSTGPHVHFEVLYKGVQVDPAQYLAVDDAN